jgi:oxidase EvaA
VLEWLDENKRSRYPKVTRHSLSSLKEWIYDPGIGVTHKSGKFFRICGLNVESQHYVQEKFCIPILHQPENGILGFLWTKRSNEDYLLFQAKFEPGNPGLIQFAPTVQSTVSNYSRVHGGKLTPFVNYFMGDNLSKTAYRKFLFSETSSRFFNKSNYNIVKYIDFRHVEENKNYIWINVSLIKRLLRVNNLLNMNARSVLSIGIIGDENYEKKNKEIRYKIKEIEIIQKNTLSKSLTKLSECKDWDCDHSQISHKDGIGYTIFGVDVSADREVANWQQPILQNERIGEINLLKCNLSGEDKYLVNMLPEAGAISGPQLAPTLTCLDPWAITVQDNKYKNFVRDCNLIWSAVHSEEGGRFYQNSNVYNLRYCTDPKYISDKHYMWLSIEELISINTNSNAVTSELRSYIAMLRFQ